MKSTEVPSKDANLEKGIGREDVEEPPAESFTTPTGEVVLANKLLCFYLKGLSKRFKTSRFVSFRQ